MLRFNGNQLSQLSAIQHMKTGPHAITNRKKQQPLVEIFLEDPQFGTMVWFLPARISEEFNTLPPQEQDSRKAAATRRLAHLGLIALGLLKYKKLERQFGETLDHNLTKLANTLSDALEQMKKLQ
jgi:hypothetical protein